MWSLSRRQALAAPSAATAAAASTAAFATGVARPTVGVSATAVSGIRTAALNTVAAAARGSLYASATGARSARVAGRGATFSAAAAVTAATSSGFAMQTAVRTTPAAMSLMATVPAYGYSAGADDLSTDLCAAAAVGDIAGVEKVLALGCDVNMGDYDGRTALHLACTEGHVRMVKFLIEECGADPNVEDRWRRSPLNDAEENDHSVVAMYMRGQGGVAASDLSIPPPPTLSSGYLDSISSSDRDFVTQDKLNEVYHLIIKQAVYSPNVVFREVDYFFNELELQPYYYRRFSPAEIANHIALYISAKRIAATGEADAPIELEITQERSGFYLASEDNVSQIKIESVIEDVIQDFEDADKAPSLTMFLSKGPAVRNGTSRLAMYIVDTSMWLSDEKPGEQESDIVKTCSELFFATKNFKITSLYENIVAKATESLSPVMQVHPQYRDGTTPVMIAFRDTTTAGELCLLTELMDSNGVTAERKMLEIFSNGIHVYSLYLNQEGAKVDNFLEQASLVLGIPRDRTLFRGFTHGTYKMPEIAYATAAQKFVFYWMTQENEDLSLLEETVAGNDDLASRVRNLRQKMKSDVVTEDRIAKAVVDNPEVVQAIYADFAASHDRDHASPHPPAYNHDLAAMIVREVQSELDQTILKEFLTFNQHILKTNFYKARKNNMTFRLDPAFLASGGWPEIPYGLFFSMGNDYTGFHVRFADIARGGIRVIRSANDAAFDKNAQTVFQENYGLAYTQNKKNKDIPEFGSKGTVLLSRDAQTNVHYAFRKYISGILDCILIDDNSNIIDYHGKEEILFFGPDENTADVMDWACEYSKHRGYSYWKAATTGKAPRLGGIPHDTYGMTTRSVHRNVLEMLAVNGVKEEDCTKFQTGGPDGDLGSNEILISKDRTIAIVDGSGVVFEPNGLHRPEMERLARERYMVEEFDRNALSADGFFVHVDDHNVTLPNGEVISSGLAFRNEFHLNPLSSADLFVPCGGRPESVNLRNVKKMFHPDGTSRFRFIVEGANLFLTQEARIYMEKKGVPVIKDACANKGGVFSSSLEVLAALSLTDDEFSQHMAVEDENNIPAFYTAYVDEVQRRIEENAYLEFHCLEKESKRTGIPRTLLSDQISDKINDLNKSISESSLFDDEAIRSKVLSKAIPALLVDQVGSLEEVVARLPEAYTRAIFCAFLASRYVYSTGLSANEFSFFNYMSKLDKGVLDAKL